MKSVTHQVGIDVDKRYLVISIDQAPALRIDNEESAIGEFASKLPAGSVVHLEASGGYQRMARRVLTNAGHTVHVHNALKVRRLAQAQGTRAKTDPLDARGLSRSGHLLPVSPGRSEERQKLTDLSRTKEIITKTIGQFKVRAKSPDLDEDARQALMHVIDVLEKKAAMLEDLFEERVKCTPYARQYGLCRSLPGIGRASARAIVCELPEDVLDRSPGQIASYAGVAPIDASSGSREGVYLGRGNLHLKKALFMPAVCSLKQPWARELYARLRAKGRCHSSAIVAVMRRLLIRVIAVLHRGTPWEIAPVT